MAEVWGVNGSTVQMVVKERGNQKYSDRNMTSLYPRKKMNKRKPITNTYGCDKNILRKTVMSHYDRGGYPRLEQFLADMQNQTRFGG
jgi:hypothetical protein